VVERPATIAIPRVWIALSIAAAIATGISSAAGAFGSAYARETPSWAAQGTGQDLVNLFVAAPLLIATAVFTARGSLRALLVWLGLLLYIVYSYVLYAFDVHFNRLFLFYVAALACAFYACVGAILTLDHRRLAAAFPSETPTRAMTVLLVAVGVLFAALWLADIVPALTSGRAPASVDEVGLPVNPIHVLDLAFALPGLIAVGALVHRRHPIGMLLAVPCATFLIVMGIAIVAMAWVMRARGVPSGGLPVPVVATTAAALVVTYRWLTAVGERRN
jgi:hypothetical protein